MLGWDNDTSIKQHRAVAKALYSPVGGLEQVRKFYEKTMSDLVRQNSKRLRGIYQLDVVRDVTNLSHANFIASLFHIPLRSSTVEDGITDQQLFDMLRTIFAYVSLDLDSTKSFGLRERARKVASDLGRIYGNVCDAVKEDRIHILKEILGIEDDAMPDYGTHFIRNLFHEGMNVDQAVWTTIPLAAEASFQGQGVCLQIEFINYHIYVNARR
jgi:hypothetical protein